MMDGTRDTVTRDGLSGPLGAGGLLIGPTLSPQLVRSATATSKPSLFTDLPRASRPIPRRSGNGLRVGQSRDS